MVIIPLLSVLLPFVVFHAATANVVTKDKVLFLGDDPALLQCPYPDTVISWFVFDQPFPDSLLTSICSVLGSGTLMRCSVSRDLDNVTLRCEADDGHSIIYEIIVEASPHAVSSITMSGPIISWEAPPTRARVETSQVDISSTSSSALLYNTSTPGTSLELIREDLVECLLDCSCFVNIVVRFVGGKRSPATKLQVPQCSDSSQTTSASPTEQVETTADKNATFTDPSSDEFEVTQMVAGDNPTGAIVGPILGIVALMSVFVAIIIICWCRHKNGGLFSPKRLPPSTPLRPDQSPSSEENAREESEASSGDQSRGQIVAGTGKPTVMRRHAQVPSNQAHRCTSLTEDTSPKEHVVLSFDLFGGGSALFSGSASEDSEQPASQLEMLPSELQVFNKPASTITYNQGSSQPVFNRSFSAPSSYDDACLSFV